MLLCARWMPCVVAVLFLASADYAYAESTFLLQLGSTDTEAKALQKWEEIKSKNTDVVGALTLRVAQVALPPENKISYRTQAGPVSSRDQATSLCKTLQSRSIECYVVETALFTAESSAPKIVPAPQEAHPKETMSSAVVSAPAAVQGLSVAATVPPATAKAVPVAPVVTSFLPAVPPPPSAPPIPPVSENKTPAVRYVPGQEPKFLSIPKSASMFAELPWLAAKKSQASVPAPAPDMIMPAREKEKTPFIEQVAGNAPRISAGIKPTAPSDAKGQVRVAEAIRVPVGSGKFIRTPVLSNLPAVRGEGGLPSQPMPKRYWAQLGYFMDEATAYDFYDEFRTAYPQLSDGVRVRITRPYISSDKSRKRVALRMGPFANAGDVRIVCKAANKHNIQCVNIRDIGSSSVTADTAVRSRYSKSHFVSEDAQENAVERPAAVSTETYWVQLGTFPSSGEAWDNWQQLRETHQKALGKLHASVTSPPMSSAVRAAFRLRAGPLVNETEAKGLCSALREGGARCIVVK